MTPLEAHIEAFAVLLARPDPPDLVGRGRHYTCTRDTRRDPWQIKRALGMAYVEHQRQAWTGGDISCVVSVRRMKMVKRA